MRQAIGGCAVDFSVPVTPIFRVRFLLLLLVQKPLLQRLLLDLLLPCGLVHGCVCVGDGGRGCARLGH